MNPRLFLQSEGILPLFVDNVHFFAPEGAGVNVP